MARRFLGGSKSWRPNRAATPFSFTKLRFVCVPLCAAHLSLVTFVRQCSLAHSPIHSERLHCASPQICITCCVARFNRMQTCSTFGLCAFVVRVVKATPTYTHACVRMYDTQSEYPHRVSRGDVAMWPFAAVVRPWSWPFRPHFQLSAQR